MIFRFFTPSLGAMLLFFSFQMNGQGFGVRVDSAEGKVGQVVCLPVRAQGFNNLVSFQYSLIWDKQVLTFDHTQNYNLPDWMANDFGSGTPGKLLVGWSSVDGLPKTRANGVSLYEVCFKLIGPLGSSSSITPGSEGFPPGSGGAEAFNANFQNVWELPESVPGLIEVTMAAGTTDALSDKASFQLSPNPTSTSAQVQMQSAVAGAASLSVTDALGRVVFEQKISLKVGGNSFEIPAKALNAKGMYQVSVQSEKGVSSQMLSVN